MQCEELPLHLITIACIQDIIQMKMNSSLLSNFICSYFVSLFIIIIIVILDVAG